MALEPRDYADMVLQSGPKNYYELAAASMKPEDAVEFLVLECENKDRLVQLLARIIHQEIGESWWQQYADDLGQIPNVNLNHYPVQLEGEIPL